MRIYDTKILKIKVFQFLRKNILLLYDKQFIIKIVIYQPKVHINHDVHFYVHMLLDMCMQNLK